MKWIFRIITHGAALVAGIALGIYILPILTAPDGPDPGSLQSAANEAQFSAAFSRDLKGSDFLHWGDGSISLSPERITHIGTLAPGPDYKLYLTPAFVEDEATFLALKSEAVRIGDVQMFNGLILDVPDGVDITRYNSVVIWCEAFGEFITAAQYQ
ncbi:DM13 domain-containing protein [Phaeobacter sp. 11ANDIMAR09]|uniref:DM13 domain-containing protein n=1 Tax=Phaeobacter sp. 11ANDIMAR09 TaxID=1225647 RepID=UPI0006C88335|nr:DM13 domain-containing protein [Phaeobacter sp. 11ANDIMAR09]KPD10963.1 phenylalanine--tRNA ligase [Phaeobacter sp. 11ANDIMAR09]